VGICFLGTPHHGADLAKWGSILTDIVNIGKPANRNVVKLLKRDSEILADLQDAFHNLLEKSKEERTKIEITCFYESLPVFRSCVVPKESAIISGELNYPVHGNHIVSGAGLRFGSLANISKDMTRFSGLEDKGYQDILREIRRLAGAIGSERIASISTTQELARAELGLSSDIGANYEVRLLFRPTDMLAHLFCSWLSSSLPLMMPLSTPGFGSMNLNACPILGSTSLSRSWLGVEIPVVRVYFG
jgi:hypothetical protein